MPRHCRTRVHTRPTHTPCLEAQNCDSQTHREITEKKERAKMLPAESLDDTALQSEPAWMKSKSTSAG